MGLVEQNINGKILVFALPFANALLTLKEEVIFELFLFNLFFFKIILFRFKTAYSKVLQIVRDKMEEIHGPPVNNIRLLLDFEPGIISAVTRIFLEDHIRACFFLLSQSVFRRVQHEGLQRLYNDEDDPQIRNATRQLCASAFVPVKDVKRVFGLFKVAVRSASFMEPV